MAGALALTQNLRSPGREEAAGGSPKGRAGQGRKAGSPERTAGCDRRLPATCLSAKGAQ